MMQHTLTEKQNGVATVALSHAYPQLYGDSWDQSLTVTETRPIWMTRHWREDAVRAGAGAGAAPAASAALTMSD